MEWTGMCRTWDVIQLTCAHASMFMHLHCQHYLPSISWVRKSPLANITAHSLVHWGLILKEEGWLGEYTFSMHAEYLTANSLTVMRSDVLREMKKLSLLLLGEGQTGRVQVSIRDVACVLSLCHHWILQMFTVVQWLLYHGSYHMLIDTNTSSVVTISWS